MKNTIKFIASIMIVGGVLIGIIALANMDWRSDEQIAADEKTANETRIYLTENYSFALPDGNWNESAGNEYEDVVDATFYSDDKKVVIRGYTIECGKEYPLSAEVLVADENTDVQYGLFFERTVVFATDETEDADENVMKRTSYCWPDDEMLCCITVQSYDDGATEVADSVILSVKKEEYTSEIYFFDSYEEALRDEQSSKEYNALLEEKWHQAQKELQYQNQRYK